ncbi:MAG: DsbA family protein [Devosiaceae bacterium]
MSRPLYAIAFVSMVAAPLAAGVYALSTSAPTSSFGDSHTVAGIDDVVVQQAVTAPLELAPQLAPQAAQAPHADAPSAPARETGLAELAANDRAGAIAFVRQALLDDPEILEEAIAALEAGRASAEEMQMSQVIADNADLLFSAEHASVMGNPDGAVILVEFLDYNCGFCKRAHQDVMRLITEHDDVRVLVKDFPVLGQGSLEASQVAVAYRAIGGDMAAFINRMMSEDSAPADASLARSVALELGASEIALDLALDNPELMLPIAQAYELAEQLNIRGTPAFILGDQRLMGAVGFDPLSQAIQAERERLAAL